MFGLSCSKELAAELEVALREAAADRSAHASYSSRYWPRIQFYLKGPMNCFKTL